jgi:RimJ/RimL family protein N-acetyltransferase
LLKPFSVKLNPMIDLAIPTLDTERLILRGHREADFENMLAMWQDPVVQRHFHGEAMSREDAWARFLKGLGMWSLRGYGIFAIEEKVSGAYVGMTGAFEVRREMTPRIDDLPEAGWSLAARFHSQGYATEATRAALGWIERKLGSPAMFCIMVPENVPSIRVAEKCGFVRSHETLYKDEATLVMKRPPQTGIVGVTTN